jgi:hypothetical protein
VPQRRRCAPSPACGPLVGEGWDEGFRPIDRAQPLTRIASVDAIPPLPQGERWAGVCGIGQRETFQINSRLDVTRPSWHCNSGRTANTATRDLPPNATEARICSYECTFCADCVETKLHNVCPNCGGGFVPRPIRPAREWRPGLTVAQRPPSDKRVHLPYSVDDIAAHSGRIRNIPPEER